jgi:hypothetical protein
VTDGVRLRTPCATVRRVGVRTVLLWSVRCDCGHSTKPRDRISLGLDEWLDHCKARVHTYPNDEPVWPRQRAPERSVLGEEYVQLAVVG